MTGGIREEDMIVETNSNELHRLNYNNNGSGLRSCGADTYNTQ